MHLFVTIPAINEAESISFILHDLAKQDCKDFTLLVCVNQPDHWWNDETKLDVCTNNLDTISIIRDFCRAENISLVLIDKCSPGMGWTGKQGGVGWARKILMDTVNQMASDHDVIVSLDADTRVETNYLSEIRNQFDTFKKASSLALPYFHNLQGDIDHQKSMLRYEIYLRSYAINLLRINHPFAYTPIGSAMAARVSAYRSIRGLTATSSGEDFYFLMKLRKSGIVIPFCKTRVFPSSRKSHRVIFGTGPTVALGAQGQVGRYPIYHPSLFDQIDLACKAFIHLHLSDHQKHIQQSLNVFPDLEYDKLRKNHPKRERFIHACFQKADAFAIYKYVRSHQPQDITDISCIESLLSHLKLDVSFSSNMDLHEQPLETLEYLRTLLMRAEEDLLQQKYNAYFALRNDLSHPIWKYMS